MRQINKFLLTIILITLVLLSLPGSVSAQGGDSNDDKVVIGGNYQLGSGQTLNGDLVLIGSTAEIEDGAVVNGNILTTGGTLTVDGEVNGSISGLGGSIFLGNTAIIHGDVGIAGVSLQRASRAQIDGDVNEGSVNPFQFSVPNRVFVPSRTFTDNPIWAFFGFIARTLAIAALAILVGLIAPRVTQRTANAVVAQPVLSGGLGLLTALIAPIALLILAITILLIPVSLIGFLILFTAGVFGWIAVGFEVGRRVASLFKQEWPLAITAGVGTLILSFVVSAIDFIPCVGWLAPFLVTILGLGAVLITRFGTRDYPLPPTGPVTPYPVISPAAPPITPTPTSGGEPYTPITPIASVKVEPSTPVEPQSRVEIFPAPDKLKDEGPITTDSSKEV